MVPVDVGRGDAAAARLGWAHGHAPAVAAPWASARRLERIPDVPAAALPVRAAVGLPMAVWAINFDGRISRHKADFQEKKEL